MNFKNPIVLSALLCASTLSAAPNADEAKGANENSQKVKEVANSLLDGVKFKGFAYMRYSAVSGDEGHGNGQNYRAKIDMTTGSVSGFSLTLGTFIYNGTSTPKKGGNYDNVQGAMAAVNKGYADRFGLSVFHANKKIKLEKSNIYLKAGRMNLNTTLNDKYHDIFAGVQSSIESKKVKFGVGYFDSWISYSASYAFKALRGSTSNNQSAAVGIGSNLALVFFDAKNIGQKKNDNGKVVRDGLSFNATYANAQGIFDYMAFTSLKYDFGAFHILAQGAATGFKEKPKFRAAGDGMSDEILSKWTPSGGRYAETRPNYGGFTGADKDDWAKTRGLYNVQLGVKFGGFKAKAGYIGSFGQGYGALLDYKGGFDMAGKFWYSNYNSSSEGFSFLGSGGRKGTSLSVGYAAMSVKLTKSFSAGLDYSYVSGNNNYAYVDVAKAPKLKDNAKGINFSEIAPSLTYAVSGFKASVVYARNVGDVNWDKTRVELRYDF